ncbi:MAG: hypothetical protein LBH54_04855 [Clostridiales bacterium]|jgi:type IV secretory pathway VirB10-like protein|nr:hypothetical protein [Clostridiales bacterium]
MKKVCKVLIGVFVLSLLFTGCGKKEDAQTPPPSPSPQVAEQAPAPSPEAVEQAPAQTPEVAEQAPATEPAPTFQDLEKLTAQLDKTTDEAERKEILAQIQAILEQAEAASAN